MDHSLHTAALQNAMPSDSNNQPTTLTRLCQPQYTPDKASAPDFDVALPNQPSGGSTQNQNSDVI